ncbi:MAG: PEGA domain-containing protein [Spirochaetales bacterium]
MNRQLKNISILCTVLCIGYNLIAQNTTEISVKENTHESNTASLRIQTNISGVDVFLNNAYKGFTPLTLHDIVPGTYTVTLKKDGWQEKSVRLSLNAQSETTLRVEMIPSMGFLRISANVSQADIYIDGVSVGQDVALVSEIFETSTGIHTVSVKKFGWAEQSQDIYIYPNTLHTASFTLQKTTFSLSSFSASPQRFNPTNSGILGQTRFVMQVTAPGTGSLNIYDANANIVYTRNLPAFTEWNNSVLWDGRDTLGIMLPNGIYTATVDVQADAGWSYSPAQYTEDGFIRSSTQVIIDTDMFYPLVTIGAGGTSIGNVAVPFLMPKGTMAFSLTGASNFLLNSDAYTIPLIISFFTTPTDWLEVSLRLGTEAGDSSGNQSVIFGSALKFAFDKSPYYIGGVLGYTYSSQDTLLPSFTEPGLSLGIIGGIKTNSILFSFTEEVIFASQRGIFDVFAGQFQTGVSALFQYESFSASLWASLYSPFDGNGIKAFGEFSTGTDISLLAFDTTLIPSVGFGYTVNNTLEHNLSVRFGMLVLIL